MKDKKIIFATNNLNKLQEIQDQIGNSIQVLSLKQIGFEQEIPEDHDTLELNALQKAETIYRQAGQSVFADDTGLLVDALNGAPGVFSARYAGEPSNSVLNIEKLLVELEGETNRKAHFKTVIALILEGKTFCFEGRCDGEILTQKSGENGFGYDPVFKPNGADRTFAEMSMQEKAEYSHRGKAIRKLLNFLKKG